MAVERCLTLEPANLRVAEPYVLVAARHGTMLVNRNDVYMGQAYLAYGECCELETRFLLSLLRVPGLVIEVGANMGVHTIPMARALGARRLLALEPQPVIFQQLCANLALNGLMNVTALPYACGSATGAVRMETPDYLQPGNFGGASVGAANPGAAGRAAREAIVQCVRLDDLVGDDAEAVGLGKVGLIKIDVEGMELEVLRGARGILDRCRPVLYVENDRVERSAELIGWLMERRYRLWWHLPPLFHAENLRGIEEDRYPQVCSFNMLCLPRESSMVVEGCAEILDPREHPLARSTARD
jgi:FkbM family methyltransferase